MNQEAEFVDMIKENETLIFKVTTIYGNNEEDKEDLYQEIVLQLWKSFNKFRNESKISTWIYRIALNTAISRLRKDKKENRTVALDTEQQIADETSDFLLEERSKKLHVQIARLNDIEKAVVLLYLENKNHSEIAEITGLSASNVSTKLSRVKLKLKQKISKQ